MRTSSNEIRVNGERVTRQPVEREDLVGTLFSPRDPGPHPAVIVLGGSFPGLGEGTAAVLASTGYAALALAYFGVEGLLRKLFEIPLEYFAEATAWLKTQPSVDPGRIAVVGASKGGELALLMGATYPESIRAVVGYSPSGLVWQGISSNLRDLWRPRSSWSLGGRPVPFVGYARPSFSETVRFFTSKPIFYKPLCERSLDGADKGTLAAASIAVEKINGPVLLISGTDDLMWPSTRLSEMAIGRLEAHDHSFHYEHLRYEGAGHIGPSYAFPIATQTGPVQLRGSLEGNGFATADSWVKTLDFLEKHLKG